MNQYGEIFLNTHTHTDTHTHTLTSSSLNWYIPLVTKSMPHACQQAMVYSDSVSSSSSLSLLALPYHITMTSLRRPIIRAVIRHVTNGWVTWSPSCNPKFVWSRRAESPYELRRFFRGKSVGISRFECIPLELRQIKNCKQTIPDGWRCRRVWRHHCTSFARPVAERPPIRIPWRCPFFFGGVGLYELISRHITMGGAVISVGGWTRKTVPPSRWTQWQVK